MSDKVPTLEEVVSACKIEEADAQWALEQLALGDQTPGLVSRSNPTPTCIVPSKGGLTGLTVVGRFLVYVEVAKGNSSAVYLPLDEAVFAVAQKGGEVTLTAKVGSDGISISAKEDTEKDKAPGYIGASLSRIHQWVRNMVIDYRRT